ncbi:hypothetical protein EDB81DRAFT_778971 [Dactylonectria macrodidyma]|uniref:Clr5 domain-containing protein n=1 Tax=Dactylonectria macrodidyma TaxID=307937 RepID=A0A9P9FK21_9HYPO|nr:hypothetical protein EDB81DRAFT_778971 [Dactylonectria macrodidyma]
MPKGRTKRHSDQEWEKHRTLVLTRYLHDGMTLEEVRSELARKGFLVSSSQLEYRCKTKWGFSKYLNQHTWQDIGTMIQRQRPKEREFFWKGQPLDPKRIIKETNRYRQHRHQLRPAALLHQSRKQQVTTTVSQQGSREFRDNDVALCQDPLQSPRVRKRLPSSQSLYRQPLHGSIGDAEFSAIVESISNNLLRDCDFGHRLQGFIDWLYNFVEAVSVSGINPDTGSITFQAAAHRLWTTIFKYRSRFEYFGNKTDEDDRRFLVVVKWLLASVLQTSSLYPSLCVALDATIRSGHTQVASLLWEMTTPSQRSSLQLRPFNLHRIASRRSKEAFLLLRRMLSQESPDWARLTLQSISQYSSLYDFREHLPSASPLFAEEIYLDGQKTASIQVVRLFIAACARAEPEEQAISKLQAAHDYLFKLGLPASADHVNTDAFMAAAMRGYVQVFDGLVTINQNPGVTNDRGFSALHTAAQYGQLDICKRILQASPPEQHDTDSFVLAIYAALSAGHLEICHFFQDCLRGSDMEHMTTTEWRKILCSCRQSETYVALPDDSKEPQSLRIGRVEFVIKSQYESLCVVCNAAFKACTEGLPELLEFCINHGSDPTSEYALETSSHMQPFTSLDAVIQAPVLGFSPGRCSAEQPPRYFAWTLPDSELPRRSYFDIGPVGSAVDRVDCAKLILQHGVQPVERHVVKALLMRLWRDRG